MWGSVFDGNFDLVSEGRGDGEERKSLVMRARGGTEQYTHLAIEPQVYFISSRMLYEDKAWHSTLQLHTFCWIFRDISCTALFVQNRMDKALEGIIDKP